VHKFTGEPFGQRRPNSSLGADINELRDIDFPDANAAIVDAILGGYFEVKSFVILKK